MGGDHLSQIERATSGIETSVLAGSLAIGLVLSGRVELRPNPR